MINDIDKIKNLLCDIICCPFCENDLSWDKKLVCNKCKEVYPISNKQIDLRLKKPKNINTTQILNNHSNAFHKNNKSDVYGFSFGYEKNNEGIDFSIINFSKKTRKPVSKLYSWLKKGEGIAIDIGSAKDKKNKKYIELAGFNYISVDYDSPDAMILADAHSLPFKNNTIACITNLAVMEHIEFPHIAGKEFFRVLESNGRMLGVVAFLQQQHMSSWYHFTHYGVYSWLTNSGFNQNNIKIDGANQKYHGIYNTASLIGLPNWFKNILLSPIYYLHRFLWEIYFLKSGIKSEKQRHLQTTGAIHFIADK